MGVPLLRALDPYLGYRKGAFALYALGEAIGVERVHEALRRLVEKHRSGQPPLATTRDLYRELEAVTPEPHRGLLHDLFAANTSWELWADRATASQTAEGAWQVTLEVRARKVVVDEAGVETELPMDEPLQVGVFARAGKGAAELSVPLYLQKHRIRSGRQTISVTVPQKPHLAGIDPYHLLDWVEREDDDNIERVKTDRARTKRPS
jgi:ABC-2 type transport system permease protein